MGRELLLKILGNPLYIMKGESMKKILVLMTFFSVLFCSLNTALATEAVPQERTADKVSFNLGGHLGYLSGDTRYHFTFPGVIEGLRVGESELEFPLDSMVGGINASIGKRGLWSIDLSLSKNLTEDTGKMKDSDWLTYSPTAQKVKFSYAEADTEMDALLLDISGRYYFIKGKDISLALVGGYRYQDLSFDISDGWMESPVGWFPRENLPGKILTYDITYKIPYGGFAIDILPSGRFLLNIQGLYGKAYAEDEDDHLLRSKRANAESDGDFYSLKAGGNLFLSNRLSIQISLEYLKIDTSGSQTQTWYATTEEAPAGTTITDIDYWAKSEEFYFLTGIRYSF